MATIICAPVCQPEATRCLLTHDEEEGADEHSARKHMLRAGLLARRFAHRAQLVCERVAPEVGQQEGAEEEGQGAVAGAPWRLHLGAADGLHVELQDGDGEDDHPEGQDEGRPRLHFTLRTSTAREVGLQVFRSSSDIRRVASKLSVRCCQSSLKWGQVVIDF